MSDPIIAESGARGTPGLAGRNTAGGDGVLGSSVVGTGVHGETLTEGGAVAGRGFLGGIETIKGQPAGAYGESSARGVFGHSDIGIGVFGHSNSGTAIAGEGPAGIGLISGVEPKFGENAGVFGQADHRGVLGVGTGDRALGVHGAAERGTGVLGETATGIAIEGRSDGSGLAGRFEGDIEITGKMTASFAEGLHLNAASLRIHGSDLLMDGRSAQSSPGRPFRALVDLGNKLVVNFNGDYRQGVELHSSLAVSGNVSASAALSAAGDISLGGAINGTDANGLNINAPTLRIHGSDFMLDGRSAKAFPDRFFRALVDATNKLIINFNGDFGLGVEVDSDLVVAGRMRSRGGDCAEQFDVAAGVAIDAGTVMIIGPDGALEPCDAPYDTRVAGVVSGGGGLEPALVLNEQDGHRALIALAGTVYCKVDASHAPIAAGDVLTTSATPGHAMKATDRGGSAGAIIGKALRPVSSGTGLIPMLVSPH